MKIKLFLSLLLISLSYLGQAQNIIVSGTVTDTKNNQPVPFATLGIKGKSVGTVANEKGVFNFIVESNQATAEEQLIVSSIGYEPSTISLARFKEGNQSVKLNPSVNALQTVTIRPQKFKTKVFGRTGSNTFMTANMYTESNHVNDNLGKEQATILSIDENCFLKDFNMYVTFNRFQNVKFRLNFYSVKDGLPDQPIIDKDVLFDVNQEKGWVNVDLTKYNIILSGHRKVAVGIQWVESVKIDSTSRSFSVSVMPTPLHAMFTRDKSQAEWKKSSPAYLAFNITADSFEKEKKEK